jgi:Methyltransferase domain
LDSNVHPLDADERFCREIAAKWESVPESAKMQDHPKMGCRLGARFLDPKDPTQFDPGLKELYNICKFVARPKRILEIGVAAGVSTSIFLAYLNHVGEGSLVSIDWPSTKPSGYRNTAGALDRVFTPARYGTGWLIPDYLRDRWTLVVDKSPACLTRVFPKGAFDMIYIDGDHGNPTVHLEMEYAWNNLERPGSMLCDDISWHNEFDNFVLARGCSMFRCEHADRGFIFVRSSS